MRSGVMKRSSVRAIGWSPRDTRSQESRYADDIHVYILGRPYFVSDLCFIFISTMLIELKVLIMLYINIVKSSMTKLDFLHLIRVRISMNNSQSLRRELGEKEEPYLLPIRDWPGGHCAWISVLIQTLQG